MKNIIVPKIHETLAMTAATTRIIHWTSSQRLLKQIRLVCFLCHPISRVNTFTHWTSTQPLSIYEINKKINKRKSWRKLIYFKIKIWKLYFYRRDVIFNVIKISNKQKQNKKWFNLWFFFRHRVIQSFCFVWNVLRGKIYNFFFQLKKKRKKEDKIDECSENQPNLPKCEEN